MLLLNSFYLFDGTIIEMNETYTEIIFLFFLLLLQCLWSVLVSPYLLVLFLGGGGTWTS